MTAALALLYPQGPFSSRGVAQLVARVLWEHEVAGSSPVSPTSSSVIIWAITMLNENQKNYLLIGLTLVVVGLGVLVGRNPSPATVHPSLIPVNVSGEKEKPEYKSPYEQNQVRNTIVKNNPLIQECYLKHLEIPSAVTSGRVQVDWHISPSGDVMSPAVVSSTMNDKVIGECIIEHLTKFKFPAPPSDKPVYTTFTYMFRKEGESMAPKMIPMTPETHPLR